MMKDQLKPWEVATIVLSGLLLVCFFACNPVKQVRKDKGRWEEVKALVIADGACKGDTVTQIRTDTLINTVIQPADTITATDWHRDTLIETRTITKPILKTITVTKFRDKYIRDIALENLYKAQRDSAVLINNRSQAALQEWKGKARTRQWIIIAILGVGLVGIIAKLKGASILKLFKK